jgi:hypothetical protein
MIAPKWLPAHATNTLHAPRVAFRCALRSRPDPAALAPARRLWDLGADRIEREIGADEIQLVGLVLIMPTILLVGLTGLIKGEALATLLGAVAGYVFGRQVSAAPKSPT